MLVDFSVLADISNGKGEIKRSLLAANGISMDVSFFDEIHVVKKYEFIHRIDQLVIAEIGKEIRLHDSQLHGNPQYIA